MLVLFIEVDTESSWSLASVGPACLGAYLQQHGHHDQLLRARLDMDLPQICQKIQEIKPDLIGFSLTTRQWLRAKAIALGIRHLGIPVIAGGLHPTFAPEQVLAAPGFDWVCLGEGEEALLELVEALQRGRSTDAIANIQGQGRGQGRGHGFGRPKLRPPFAPLERLPWMERSLLDEWPGVVHIATQRGCPFPCTYCAARMYDELYSNQAQDYGRRRSHDDVLAEIQTLHDAGRLNFVIFLDDTFTLNPRWVEEFCRRNAEGLKIPFSLHARVETISEAMVGQLAAGGCRMITYGVESGSERLRREVLKRPVNNARFRKVFQWTKAAGIIVTANYMMGMPHETPDDLAQTLQLAEELESYDFGYFVFYPYPGTALFRECREKGYLPPDYENIPANHRQSILRLPTLTQADIDDCYNKFTALRTRIYAARDTRSDATEHVEQCARNG